MQNGCASKGTVYREKKSQMVRTKAVARWKAGGVENKGKRRSDR